MIFFIVSSSLMSEMTVGLFRKYRALDELHNPDFPSIQSHLRTKIHSTGVYIMHLTYHLPYITAVELLLQTHGPLILLALFWGILINSILDHPFSNKVFFKTRNWSYVHTHKTTKQTKTLPKNPTGFYCSWTLVASEKRDLLARLVWVPMVGMVISLIVGVYIPIAWIPQGPRWVGW